MPKLANAFPLSRIIQPIVPARTSMDEGAMLDLMDSIRKNGLFNPVTLMRHVCDEALCKERNHPHYVNDDRGESCYEIVAGHRRYTAHKRLEIASIRALLWEPGEIDLFAVRVAENSEVEEWNPADQALFIAELWNKQNLPVEDMARLLKKSVAWCDRRYALLSGYDEVFCSLKEGQINMGVAEELNKCRCEHCKKGGATNDCPCNNVMGNSCSQSAIYYLKNAVACGASAALVKQWVYCWKIAVSNAPTEPPVPTPVTESPVVIENPVTCALCGGDKDPWNLKMVYLHEWHLKQFEQQKAELEGLKMYVESENKRTS